MLSVAVAMLSISLLKGIFFALYAVMFIATLTVAIVSFIAGAGVLVHAFLTAPEGLENESGFDIVWRNNHPGVKDVVCIWAPVHAVN
jgi:hypothetical protein